MERIAAAAILNALPVLVRRCGTFNDLLLTLLRGLQPHIPGLWRLSVRRFIPEADQLEFVAVWSASDTRITPGMHISTMSSSMPEVLQLDRPVFSVDTSRERTLLDELLAAEGVSSWVSIPLRADQHVVGLLNVSSVQPNAIEPRDEGFFTELGKILEPRFVQLLGEKP